jgi:hypothetical protein
VLHEDCRCRLTHELGNVYCGDFLKGGLFHVELYETIVFRLFNSGDSPVCIVSRRMRNYSVIMISELVNYIGESVVTDTSYGISVHVQRKCTGNLIRDSASVIEILTGITLV